MLKGQRTFSLPYAEASLFACLYAKRLFSLSFRPSDVMLFNMTHGLHHPEIDAQERIEELAALLACGLLRLRLRLARQSSALSRCSGESSLDGSPDQSMHVAPEHEGLQHDMA